MVDLLVGGESRGLETSKDVAQTVPDNAHKCEQCRETFPSVAAKRKHERFYHLFSKPFVCECGQKFGKLSEVNYHVRRVHNKERNYVCQTCNKAFFKNSDLVIHRNIHDPSAKFICEDCGRRFTHVSNLIRHSRIHTGIKPYLCLPCNKRFSQVTALRQHEITEKHKEKVSRQNAGKLDQTWNGGETETDLGNRDAVAGAEDESAMRKKKDDGKQRKWWFYCKICGERFPFSVLLRDHETKHLANKDMRCNSCKTEFSSLKDFKTHSCSTAQDDGATKNETRPEGAEDKEARGSAIEDEALADVRKEKEVELTLTQNGQIMLDNDEVLLILSDNAYGLLLINNGVTIVEKECLPSVLTAGKAQEQVLELMDDAAPAHTCAECNKVFDKRRAYLRHLGSHSKRYKCTECAKSFSWNSSLRNHVVRKHGKKTKHSCLRCGKTYYSSLLVERHVERDHLNIRSYKCEQCGKAFFRRYDLKVHARVHTNERPYVCEMCGKGFRHLSHSIRHDKTHLKDAVTHLPSHRGNALRRRRREPTTPLLSHSQVPQREIEHETRLPT